MAKTNGQVELKPEDMTIEALLEVLVEGMKQITEEQLEQKEILVELLEKVNNLSLPGTDYGVED